MLYAVYAILGVCCTRCMLYSVYAVLGVCCTRCMLYSVYTVLGVRCTRCMLCLGYAVLGVNFGSWHGEIESDDLTSCFQVMVELRTTKREMRGCCGNHHEKLVIQRISCASQYAIPNTAGTSPDQACTDSDTSSLHPNHTSRTPDLSYPLLSSTSFESSSLISGTPPQLYHHRRKQS
jgi:hypothetical protein